MVAQLVGGETPLLVQRLMTVGPVLAVQAGNGLLHIIGIDSEAAIPRHAS